MKVKASLVLGNGGGSGAKEDELGGGVGNICSNKSSTEEVL